MIPGHKFPSIGTITVLLVSAFKDNYAIFCVLNFINTFVVIIMFFLTLDRVKFFLFLNGKTSYKYNKQQQR